MFGPPVLEEGGELRDALLHFMPILKGLELNCVQAVDTNDRCNVWNLPGADEKSV